MSLWDTFKKLKKKVEKKVEDAVGSLKTVADDLAEVAIGEAENVLKMAEDAANSAQGAANKFANDLENAAKDLANKFGLTIDPGEIARSLVSGFTGPIVQAVQDLLTSEADRAKKKRAIERFFMSHQIFDGPHEDSTSPGTGTQRILCFTFLSATSKKVLPGPISKGSDGTNAFFSRLLRQKSSDQWVRGIIPMDFVDKNLDTIDLIIEENLRSA